MRRRRLPFFVWLLAVLLTPALWVSPASAAPTVSVVPDTDLVDFQTVAVTGGGFTPNVTVALVQCRIGAVSESDCDISNVRFITSDSSGNIASDFVVERIIAVGGDDVDCAPANCLLAAANLSNIAENAGAVLNFDPNVPPAPRLDVQIEVDEVGFVVAKTGQVTLHGTVTCNLEATAFIDASVRQRAGRAFIDAFLFGGSVPCDAEPTDWTVTGSGFNGIFKGGSADVQVGAFAQTATQFDSDFVSTTVKLRGLRMQLG